MLQCAGGDTAATGQQPATNEAGPTGSTTPSAAPASGGGSGLSTGAMIGIAASVGSLFVTAIGVGVKIYYTRRKAKRMDQQLQTQSPRPRKDSF
jgi:hypothetical protein